MEEFKTIRLYVELEHRRSNGRFEYQLKLDPMLDAVNIKIMPLILQPFIENAIWHGLGKKDEGGMLRVEIKKLDDTNMEVQIEDNGVGRKQPILTSVPSNSLGQSITQQRLEKLMEVTQKKATVQIVDLKDNQNQPTGTRVLLYLPILY